MCEKCIFGLMCEKSIFGLMCEKSIFGLMCEKCIFGLICEKSIFGLMCEKSIQILFVKCVERNMPATLRKHAYAILHRTFLVEKMKIVTVNSFFYIFAQNIDCEYTLEPIRRGGPNEYPQSILEHKNIKSKLQDPVVQNFVSLTSSFRPQLVKEMPST